MSESPVAATSSKRKCKKLLFRAGVILNRIDFPKIRRVQGRALSKYTRAFAALIQPLAAKHGIDLQSRLKDASARRSEEQRLLAERLQESVVPLFIANSRGAPDRVGSCVLVRLDSDYFAFTAAHVLQEIGSAPIFAPCKGKGGKLRRLPPCTAHLRYSEGDCDLDICVLALPALQLGAFAERVFLTEGEIEQEDRRSIEDLESFYFVLGYPASRTQVKASRKEPHIYQRSFQCSTYTVDVSEYAQERMFPSDHILLDLDHKEILIAGRRVSPPKLQGISGGGIFHIFKERSQVSLVAIATQNRRSSRLIVGTRIKHFLAVARELKTMSQPRSF